METKLEGLMRLMILYPLQTDNQRTHQSSVGGAKEGGLQRKEDEVTVKNRPEIQIKTVLAFQKKTDLTELEARADQNLSKSQALENASKALNEETPAFL